MHVSLRAATPRCIFCLAAPLPYAQVFLHFSLFQVVIDSFAGYVEPCPAYNAHLQVVILDNDWQLS